MAPTGLYVFGTSVLWGQGHRQSTKVHSRLAKWLKTRHGGTVTVHHRAHSGAVLLGGANETPLHGEVPVAFPSVSRQIQQAPSATEERVYVLIDGGINDVGVFNIVNPTLSRTKLKQRTRKACNEDMRTVLKQLVDQYPRADIRVLGYYQIVADHIRRHAKDLATLLEVLNVCDSEDLKKIDFVARVVDNCKLFWHESDRQLQRAVADIDANAEGSVMFLPSSYTPANGLFGRSPLLFNLGDRDPLLDDRVLPCTRAILAKRTKAHCYIAAIGHPNKPGATRYLNAIKTSIRSV